MPTITLYAASSVSGNVSDPNNALGVADGVFTTDGNTNSNWSATWRMAALPERAQPVGTQTFRVQVRKGSNSNDPTITGISLRQGSTTVATLLSSNLSVTQTGSGVELSYTFSGGDIDPNEPVDVFMQTSGAGGGGSARNSVEVDAFAWDVDYDLLEVILKTYDGNQWVEGSLKMWDGAEWVVAPLKRWNGTTWVDV